MATEAVIVVGDGRVTALAGGPVSIADMGKRSTRRASHLDFDPAKNEWVVWDSEKTNSLYSHPDYNVALQWETDHFNRLLSLIG
ncbi:hypothetical protein OpiT1DRAFT_05651 [Opitutaceae bacterium TAV1]|nr:hypothetical protein OpiT1DRAFT_05651 [Opitutaceae bacterium TAV1]